MAVILTEKGLGEADAGPHPATQPPRWQPAVWPPGTGRMGTHSLGCWAVGRGAGELAWIWDASPAASIGPVNHVVAIREIQPRDPLCTPAIGEREEEEAVAGSGATVTDVRLPGICWGIFLSAGCECATRQSHLPHSHFWES